MLNKLVWLKKVKKIDNNEVIKRNDSFKNWLKDNDIEMYFINNEGKSVAAERFVKILKTKIYKYMTSNGYIDKLDDIVGECNNTYHRTI